MKFDKVFLPVFGALLLVLVGLTVGPGTAGAEEAMPAFSLASALDGKTISSSDFKDKALLVTFFATWCPPCRQEIPSLIKLQNEYGAKGFSVIGMSMDDEAEVVVKLIKKEEINYPVLMAKAKTAGDFGGVIGIPTSFLINREGVVVKRYPGYVPYAMLEKDISSLF